MWRKAVAVAAVVAAGCAPAADDAPAIVVTTPRNEHHEFGALMVAVAAGDLGWRAVYLGPNLPAEEIAAATRLTGARIVALSLVHYGDDPLLPGELRALKGHLPPGTTVMLGGRAAGQQAALAEQLGFEVLDSIPALRARLAALSGS